MGCSGLLGLEMMTNDRGRPPKEIGIYKLLQVGETQVAQKHDRTPNFLAILPVLYGLK